MKTLHSLSSFVSVFENASKGKEAFRTFDDFLTLCMYHVTKDPHTDGMYYENDFARISEAYKQSGTYDDLIRLPSIFFRLVLDRILLPDMIGEFYMTAITPETNKTILSPFPLCLEMTQLFSNDADGALCILDTSVGTGRMLLAFEQNSREGYSYYGIDTTPLLVKLAAVNMFMHNLNGEVVCAQDSGLENFSIGYRINHHPDHDDPKGIFKFEDKEESEILFLRDFLKEQPKKRLFFY
ncbi:MAG: N-6 DNA methylase [Bacteroidetes bacterium]|nr:N-6 DNA methylase [Bacteroidota bacterium]